MPSYWLLSLSIIFQDHPHCSVFQCFIHFYGWIRYSIECISHFLCSHSSLDTKKCFYILVIVLLWTWVYLDLFESLISVLWGIYLKVVLLGHMLILCLRYWGACCCFYKTYHYLRSFTCFFVYCRMPLLEHTFQEKRDLVALVHCNVLGWQHPAQRRYLGNSGRMHADSLSGSQTILYSQWLYAAPLTASGSVPLQARGIKATSPQQGRRAQNLQHKVWTVHLLLEGVELWEETLSAKSRSVLVLGTGIWTGIWFCWLCFRRTPSQGSWWARESGLTETPLKQSDLWGVVHGEISWGESGVAIIWVGSWGLSRSWWDEEGGRKAFRTGGHL